MSTPLKIFFMFFVLCMMLHAEGCYTSTSFTGDVADLSWLDDGSAPEEIIAEPDRAEMVELPHDPPVEHEMDLIDIPEDPAIEDIVEDLPEEEPPPAAVLWSDDYEDADIEWMYQRGDWTLADGKLVQSTDMMSELWYPGHTWNDAAVEVSVMADEADTAAPRAVAGLLFRVQSIDPNSYYLCELDFNGSVLVLLRYDSEAPGYHTLCTSSVVSPAASTGTWYKIQVVMNGTSLTCRWVWGGAALVEISVHDDIFASGAVGLFTNKASAEFDDLVVWDRRPDDWPVADSIEDCP